MSMIVFDVQEICHKSFRKRTGCDLLVHCFPVLASCCTDILDGNDMSWIRHEKSGRRPSIQRKCMMEIFQATSCEKARSAQDTVEPENFFMNCTKQAFFVVIKESTINFLREERMKMDVSNFLFHSKIHLS